MDLSPAQPESDPIAAILRTILLGLKAKFGNWWPLEPRLTLVFYNRISTIHRRMERLLARFRAGKVLVVTRRATTPVTPASRKPAIRMPRKWGWLLDSGKHHAAYFTHRLHDLLTTPEMMELLEAAPQAKTTLRPLCRALGVELPWTVTPPRTPKPRQPRKPRPKPEPFRTKLPRGVITWARREKRLERARAEIKRLRGVT